MDLIGQKTPEQKAEIAAEKARNVTIKERCVQLATSYIVQVYSLEEKKKANLIDLTDRIYKYLTKD